MKASNTWTPHTCWRIPLIQPFSEQHLLHKGHSSQQLGTLGRTGFVYFSEHSTSLSQEFHNNSLCSKIFCFAYRE